MKQKIYLLLIFFALCLPMNAVAEIVTANNIGNSLGLSFTSSVCYYETYSDFRFSIIIKSSLCPMTVYYDTDTGSVS